MKKNYVYILDIGSCDVTLYGLYVESTVGGCFFSQRAEHDGVTNFFFKNPEHTALIVKTLLDECVQFSGREITEVYVVLPQRFFRYKTVRKSSRIKNETVNKFDVEDLIASCAEEIEGCEFSECVPIAYRVADDYIDNPIGQSAEELEIIASDVGMLTRIQEFFTDLGKRYALRFRFVPKMRPVLDSLQNEIKTNRSSRIAMYVYDDYADVCYAEMCAPIAHRSVNFGAKRFVSALCEAFTFEDKEAKEILRHVNLQAREGEYTSFGRDNGLSVERVNAVVRSVIDEGAKEIADVIDALTYGASLPVYITGSFVCAVRGMDSYLTEKIRMPVSVLCPDVGEFGSPDTYAVAGLWKSLLTK